MSKIDPLNWNEIDGKIDKKSQKRRKKSKFIKEANKKRRKEKYVKKHN